MSVVNGVWHSAEVSKPESGKTVLCVKEKKNGERVICLGHWHEAGGMWVTGGGNNNVILWMPLPRIPGRGNNV